MAIHELNLSKEEAGTRFEAALAKMPPALADYYRRSVNLDDPGEGALWLRQGVNGSSGAVIGALQDASEALIGYSNSLARGLGKKEGYEEGRREAAEDTCEWLENEVYPGKRGASLSQRIWDRERSFAETRGVRRPGKREVPNPRTPAAVLQAMLRAYERATFDALVAYFKTDDPREEAAQQGRARLLHRQCEVIRREAAGVAAGYADPVDFNNPGGMMVYPERLMADYKARLDGERPLDAPPLEV